MKMFEKECYKECILAFTQTLVVRSGKLDINESVFLMRCLSEVDDETLIEEVCQTTIMNRVVHLVYFTETNVSLTSSDWAAVTFVCKHLENLMRLDLDLSHSTNECHFQVMKLLQQRCIENLILVVRGFDSYSTAEHVFTSLMNSKCVLNHKHFVLTKFSLENCYITDKCLSMICKFFEEGHAIGVQALALPRDEISSDGVPKLCQILDNKFSPELRILNLLGYFIGDKGVITLLDAIIKYKKFLLNMLVLKNCCLTDECIPTLCELITNKDCNLTNLIMEANRGISDEGLQMLCEHALLREHCKLKKLNLSGCSITDKCIPKLRETLQDENCVLIDLRFSEKRFTKNGRELITEIGKHEVCRARGLKIIFTTIAVEITEKH